MTNHDKNMRTLIICFVLTILALIPLRIVEIREMNDGVKVLGEQRIEMTNQVQLPNADIKF